MAITKYLDLITSAYGQQPNFMAWLSASLSMIDDGMQMTNSIPTNFTIDTAIGVQLDVIGKLVGQLRDIGVPLTGTSSILDDTHYRMVLRARIARNQWDGSIPSIYAIWEAAFPGTSLQIIDNQNMTMQANITGLTDTVATQLVTAGLIIPKPMGVTLNVIANTSISGSTYVGAVVTTSTQYSLSTKPAPAIPNTALTFARK